MWRRPGKFVALAALVGVAFAWGGRSLTAQEKAGWIGSLAPMTSGEQRIRQALTEPTSLEFIETPLSDVVEFLKESHNIPIEVDTKALDDVGLVTDVPVTRNLKGISLRSALRLMLGDLELTFVVRDEVLFITTEQEAARRVETRVYSAGPISNEDGSAEELAKLVQSVIERPLSEGATAPTVTPYGPLLVVRDSEAGHEAVEKLLAQIAAGLGVKIERPVGEAAAREPAKSTHESAASDPFGP